MTDRSVHTMSLVGGHLALDFVNTVDSRIGEPGPDYLNCYEDLLIWAGRRKLIDAETQQRLHRQSASKPDTSDAALSRAKALREALYSLCCVEIDNRTVEESDLKVFNAALQSATARRRVAAKRGVLEWIWQPDDTLDHIADRVSVAACALIIETKDSRRPIRQCPGHNCGWLFLDTSRGGRRQWCSDKTCGTPARVRRFRAG
ncbi:putative RNA-binding Zn ribbon-like protein [Bosea sp. OAE506]|uniref:CGNR zinc finger domain-containing protein n=1 Tax=Bosea sp. OAE506 TaxID=2663870 RepID=UPI0017892153